MADAWGSTCNYPQITNIPDYKTLRVCAQAALYHNNNNGCGAAIYGALNCPSPPVSACLCREDLRPLGSSFLTHAVESYCHTTNAFDISAAIGVWDKVCGNRGPP